MSTGNQRAHEAWQQNAAFWDERMGEGNDFVELLIWPAVENLLAIKPGDRILDVACGNGLTCRRLAARGARVLGIDFSEKMIARAMQRSIPGESIEYRVIDATDRNALSNMARERFDAVLCNMALFDMADISPLFEAIPALLQPGGHFVFSILHPCFNNPFVVQTARLEPRGNQFVPVYSIEVPRYLTAGMQEGVAMPGQPALHPCFHRSLSELLQTGFKAGMVLDGFEERAFLPSHVGGNTALSWSGNYSEIPPVLVCRMLSKAKSNA